MTGHHNARSRKPHRRFCRPETPDDSTLFDRSNSPSPGDQPLRAGLPRSANHSRSHKNHPGRMPKLDCAGASRLEIKNRMNPGNPTNPPRQRKEIFWQLPLSGPTTLPSGGPLGTIGLFPPALRAHYASNTWLARSTPCNRPSRGRRPRRPKQLLAVIRIPVLTHSGPRADLITLRRDRRDKTGVPFRRRSDPGTIRSEVRRNRTSRSMCSRADPTRELGFPAGRVAGVRRIHRA